MGLCDLMDCSPPLSFTLSWNLFRYMSNRHHSALEMSSGLISSVMGFETLCPQVLFLTIPFFTIHLDIRIFEPSRDPHNFNTWSKSTHSEQVHSSVFYYLHLLKQPSSISLRTSILWQSLALFTLEFLKDVRIYQTQHFSSLPNGQVGTDELFYVSLFVVLFFFGFALKTLLCKNKHPNLVKCFSLFTGCSCSQGLAHSVEVSSFSLSF